MASTGNSKSSDYVAHSSDANEENNNIEMLAMCCERLKEVVKKYESDLRELRNFTSLERHSMQQLLDEQFAINKTELLKVEELQLKLNEKSNENQSIVLENGNTLAFADNSPPLDMLTSIKENLRVHRNLCKSDANNISDLRQQNALTAKAINIIDGYNYTDAADADSIENSLCEVNPTMYVEI